MDVGKIMQMDILELLKLLVRDGPNSDMTNIDDHRRDFESCAVSNYVVFCN